MYKKHGFSLNDRECISKTQNYDNLLKICRSLPSAATIHKGRTPDAQKKHSVVLQTGRTAFASKILIFKKIVSTCEDKNWFCYWKFMFENI
jgi:hypothetical protein